MNPYLTIPTQGEVGHKRWPVELGVERDLMEQGMLQPWRHFRVAGAELDSLVEVESRDQERERVRSQQVAYLLAGSPVGLLLVIEAPSFQRGLLWFLLEEPVR